MRINREASLIVITGPTASGKTGLSLKIAKQKNGAILSADSRMVFQGLDIGTGKPTWEYRTRIESPWCDPIRSDQSGPVYTIQGIEHYGLDIRPPEAPWTLDDWLRFAREMIATIRADGKLPILVGGTGLYLKALLLGFEPPPTDPTLRAQLEELPKSNILAELQKSDPLTAQREKDNPRRLIRALEVVRLTGKPMSQARRGAALKADVLVLRPSLSELYQRIDVRLTERLHHGLIEEVETLLAGGVSQEWLLSLGLEYGVITRWRLDGGTDREKLEDMLRRAIHAYARRQTTFFRTQFKEIDP